MKRKWFVFIGFAIIIFATLLCFFIKNNYKTYENGNNINKSAESIKEYILNLESYEATMQITVYSNKTENSYKVKQTYQKENIATQEILEPQSVKGLVISYNSDGLKIENTNLNLTKIYKDYPYIANNYLWLSDFIQEYKTNENASLKEDESQVILQTQNNTSKIEQTLYIDKNTIKPSKLIVKDKNQKELVYIVYSEITIKVKNISNNQE
jgi:outer membrane lipoprotein-sorting protein